MNRGNVLRRQWCIASAGVPRLDGSGVALRFSGSQSLAGSAPSGPLDDAAEEYQRRLARHMRIDETWVKAERLRDGSAAAALGRMELPGSFARLWLRFLIWLPPVLPAPCAAGRPPRELPDRSMAFLVTLAEVLALAAGLVAASSAAAEGGLRRLSGECD